MFGSTSSTFFLNFRINIMLLSVLLVRCIIITNMIYRFSFADVKTHIAIIILLRIIIIAITNFAVTL